MTMQRGADNSDKLRACKGCMASGLAREAQVAGHEVGA